MNYSNHTTISQGLQDTTQGTVSLRQGMLPGIINKSTLSMVILVNSVIISFVIGLLGSLLNIVNIAVFVKQGLKDPINITLFVLSISDFGSVFTIWLRSAFLILHFFPKNFPHLDPRYLSGLLTWPHAVFIRVSCLLTVFIAMERWLCVTFPLHVSRIITPVIAKVYNCVVMGCLVSTFISLYCYSQLSKMYLPQENRTLFVLTLTRAGLKYAVTMSSIVTSVYLATFGLLVIFTILTIVKLNWQTKWRQSMSTSAQIDATTAKSRKVVKMVVAICLIFIICSIPSVGGTLAYMFVPGYVELGRYYNLYMLVNQICFTLEISNSTANFFIYFHMSSNYYKTLDRLFGKLKNTCWSADTGK